MKRFSVFAGVVLLLGGTALAQETPVPDELQGMVGDWVLEQQDPDLPHCALKFTDQQAIGGWAVEVPAACAPPYPETDSLAAWNVDPTDNSVLLLDATRKVVLRLFEDEDGLFDTDPDVEPQFYLLAAGEDGDGSDGSAAE